MQHPVHLDDHAAAGRQRRKTRKYRLLMESLEARTLLTAAVGRDDVRAALRAGLVLPGGVEALKAKPAPKPNITAAVTAGPSSSGLVTISGKTYAKASVTLQVVSTGATQPVVKASTKGVYQISFTVGYGNTLVQLTAKAPGHKPTSTTLTVNRPDTVPPVINLGGLAPGSLSRTEATIMGTVTDVGSGVASLQAKVDGGGEIAVPFDSAGSFSFTTNLPADGTADGPHAIVFEAIDRAGNASAPAMATFVLDTRPPALAVSAIPPLVNASPTLTGTIADRVDGITTFQAQVDNGTPTLISIDGSGHFGFPAGRLADGPHTIELTATDGAGNVATTSVGFRLDTQPPVISVSAPPAGAILNASPTITGVVTDATSVVALLQAQVDGAASTPVALDAAGHFSLPAGPLADGQHSIELTATDGAGNVVSTEVSFNLETQAPTINIQSPATGLFTNVDPAITGTVTAESGSAVAVLQAQVDSGPSLPVSFDSTTGAFHFTTQLPLDGTADGAHAVHFRAVDSVGNTTTVDLGFTLDTTPPPQPRFSLAQADSEGASSNLAATNSQVTLVGQTDPDITVTLVGKGMTALTTKSGTFQFVGVSLTQGDNLFTVQAADRAGNTSQYQATIHRDLATGSTNQIIFWNQVVLQAIENDASTPEYASRALAIVSAADYDSVNAIDGTPGYYVTLQAPSGASADAAVAAAAYTALSYLYPAQQSYLNSTLAAALATIPDSQAKTDGMEVGQSIANAIIATRQNDGATNYVDYTPSSVPGDWVPTAPTFMPAENPQWATLKPFAMTSPSQFRPPPPPDLTSKQWADDVNKTLSLGAVDSTARTADETQIALFWNDRAGTYTSPGHWNSIAEQVAQQAGYSLAQDARLFAELNIAEGDAAIVAWDAKYTYNTWRPITVAAEAASAGNPNVQPIPGWTPLLSTPPFPEYISGHSTFSSAAATVMTAFFGSSFSFSTDSMGLPGVTRSYASFLQAADEAGESRIDGGIHFEFSNQAGLTSGANLGNYVIQTFSLSSDTTPPAITISSPTTSAVASTGNITITGTVLDNLSGVASLQMRVDGQAFVPVAFNPSGEFSVKTALATDGSADGPHSISFEATDVAGNVTPLVTVALTLDTKAPVLTLTSPLPGALTDGETLTGTADGTGSSITALSYHINNGTEIPVPFNPDGTFTTPLDDSDVVVGTNTLTVTAHDAAGNVGQETVDLDMAAPPALTLQSEAPADGSTDVGVTQRPRIVFSRPIDPATLTPSDFSLTDTTGATLPTTIIAASDGSGAWLFPTATLPGASLITLHVLGASIKARDGTELDADGSGTPGSTLQVSFTTVSTAELPSTTLSGIVADPGPDLKPGTVDDVAAGPDRILMTGDDVYLHPIAGVKVSILGLEDQAVTTGPDGSFFFNSVPAGDVKLVLDGTTATNPPPGYYFPTMTMDLTIQLGQSNTVMGSMSTPAGEGVNPADKGVYLPRLATSILQTVEAGQPKAETMTISPDSGLNLTPDQQKYLSITIPPDETMIGTNGQPMASAQLGISVVPPSLVADMLPPGVLQHTFDITVQAPDVALFTEPLAFSMPNVFNQAPGTTMNLLSFDHTTGRLVIEGTMTVSADGKSVTTDPGVGITHPGWHGGTQGSPCQVCQTGDDSGGGAAAVIVPLAAGNDPASGHKGNLKWSGLDDQFFAGDNFKFPVMRFENTATDRTRQQDRVVIKIQVDGPYDSFLEGNLETTSRNLLKLCPADSGQIQVIPMPLLDMVASGDFTADQLYAINVHVKGYAQRVGGTVLLDRTFNIGRWLAVVDPMEQTAPSFNAYFLKTVGGTGFVRHKTVEYHLPMNVSTSFGGGNDMFQFGASVEGDGEATWNFTPLGVQGGAQARLTDDVTITIGGHDLPQDVQAAGTDHIVSVRGPDMNQFTQTMLAFLQDDARYNASSDAFKTEWGPLRAGGVNPNNQALMNHITATVNEIMADVTAKFQFAGSALQIVPGVGGTAVSWLPDLTGGAFGQSTRNVGDAMASQLSNPNLPLAAQEYLLGEIANVREGANPTDNFIRYNFDIQTRYKARGVDYAQFVADSIAHEIGHSLGLSDAYRFSAYSVPPKDLMRLGSVYNGDSNFAYASQVIIKAGLGIAPDLRDAPQGVADAIKIFKANYNNPNGLFGLSADGPPQPILTVSTATTSLLPGDPVDFGTVVADGPGGASGHVTLTLSNTGSDTLTLNSVALAGGAFSLANAPVPGTTLDVGQSLSLDAVFDPTAAGPASAVLTVTTNEPADATFQATLQGTGLTPSGQIMTSLPVDPLTERADQNNFGGADVGGAPSAVDSFLTITNTGGGPLTIRGIDVTRGQADYSITNLPAGFGASNPIVLSPGGSFALSVAFAPSAVGLRPGTITILSDDPAQPVLHQAVIGTGLSPGASVLPRLGDYVAVENVDNPALPVFRQRTDALGNWSFVLPAQVDIHYAIFDPVSGLIAHGADRTENDGVETMLPDPDFAASTAPDTDGDGLPDDVEFAVGTSPTNRDTAGTGLGDFAAVEEGLNPLGSNSFPTGLIANLPIPGGANQVAVKGSVTDPMGQTAFVATGTGLAIVNVMQFNDPVLVGQLALPNAVLSLAVDTTSQTVALVTAPASTGLPAELDLVDVSELVQPKLLETVSIPASSNRIVVSDGLAYISAGTELLGIDIASEAVLQTLDLGGTPLIDLAQDQQYIYAIHQDGELQVVDTSGPVLKTRGSISMTGAAGRLFVGGGIAYITNGGTSMGGYATVDVSNPDNPRLLGRPSAGTFQTLPSAAIAANGSGIALEVGTVGTSPGLVLFNVTDPTNTDSFLTSFNLPGTPSSLTLASGIAYVADGSAGLQVVNYLSFDTKGVPPTVSISSPVADVDPSTPGTQVAEGSSIPITANVSDDVQVRNVELLVNGQVVTNDVSFPFDLVATAPLLASGQTSMAVQVRATDTGGNSTLSNVLTFGLVADRTGPTVVAMNPAPGVVLHQTVRSIELLFDKPIAPASANPSAFTVVAAGPDGKFDTADDVIIPVSSVVLSPSGHRATLILGSTASGAIRLTVSASVLRDLAGNALDGEFHGNFPSGDGQPGGDFVAGFTISNIPSLPPGAFPFQSFSYVPPGVPIIPGVNELGPILAVDLNDDGRSDLIRLLPTLTGGVVSVALSEPGGGYSDPVLYTVGEGPTRLVAGDVNGDGKLDLIVLDNPGNSFTRSPLEISVLLGNGDGTFQNEKRITTGLDSGAPGDLALGDFNGDGKLDLAVSIPGTSVISSPKVNDVLAIFTGNGDGTFAAPKLITLDTAGGESHLLAADLNGDGKLDLISGQHVYLGNGDGTFQVKPFAGNDGSVAVGNFEGNGSIDVISTYPFFDNTDVTLYHGRGDGTFQSLSTVTLPIFSQPNGFGSIITSAVADLNGDGKPDLVVSGDGAAVLLNTGGKFGTPDILPLDNSAVSVAIGDANGDGKPDILVGSGPDTVAVLGNGDGTFQTPLLDPDLNITIGGGNVYQVRTVADINGDGIPDVVRLGNGSLQVALGRGDGSLGTFTPVESTSFNDNIFVADLNGDGIPDLVLFQHGRANALAVLLGKGNGTFGPEQVITSSRSDISVAALADVNGDGKPDLIEATSTGDLIVRLGVGDGTFGAELISKLGLGGISGDLTVGDFNHDNKLDLATIVGGSLPVVALGKGDGTFAKAPLSILPNRPQLSGATLVAADFNGDGKLDLVAIDENQTSIVLFQGVGDGTFQAPDIIPVTGARDIGSITAADLNGDGIVDLVLSEGSAVDLLLGDGDGTFQSALRFNAPFLQSAIVADLNRDGLLDIVAGDTILLQRKHG
jgi:hypothetical protein